MDSVQTSHAHTRTRRRHVAAAVSAPGHTPAGPTSAPAVAPAPIRATTATTAATPPGLIRAHTVPTGTGTAATADAIAQAAQVAGTAETLGDLSPSAAGLFAPDAPEVRGPVPGARYSTKGYEPAPPADAQPTDGAHQRTPRPKGVATGFPWSPRESVRSFTASKFVAEAVEFLDEHPFVPDIGAFLVHWYTKIHPTDDGTPGAPVATDPADAWKFSAIGDYGAGTTAEAKVAANVKAGHPELLVTVGDNVYPTGRWQDYVKNFDPYYGQLAREIPFMPSMGNHDLYRDDATSYFTHFAQLKGLPYYTFEHKDAQFYALDGDEDLRVGSPQYSWLEGELRASKSRWKVVYLHYPLYATGSFEEFTELRNALQPLMAKYGVQLCIDGHDHVYEREQVIDGVAHVLTGGGGQTAYGFTKKKRDFTVFRAAVNHHVEFSVGHDAIVLRTIDADGKLIDSTTFPWHGAPGQSTADGAAMVGARPATHAARHTIRATH